MFTTKSRPSLCAEAPALRTRFPILGVIGMLALGACGAADEPSTEQRPSSVLNGTATNLRPEVGLLSIAGSCTATLISNRHFITAAHCLCDDAFFNGYREGTGPVTATLSIDVNSDGITQVGEMFQVRRIWGHRLPVHGTCPNGWGSSGGSPSEDDWAFGELVNPVPASVVPAQLASNHNTSWHTIMGYGCTDRANPGCAGFGTKRSASYTDDWQRGQAWNGNSSFGDSGGPTFQDFAGALEGITSGFRWYSTHPVGWGDVKADAVAFRPWIDAHLAAANQTGLCYRAILPDGYGTQRVVCNGQTAGTTGMSLRMEGFQLWNNSGASIAYEAYVPGNGWGGILADGELAGTRGQDKRIESLRIYYFSFGGEHVSYRVHIQDIGWTGWLTDGALAGTVGSGKRIEALEVLPNELTCKSRCGGHAPGGCYCDAYCTQAGDCCRDKQSLCGN